MGIRFGKPRVDLDALRRWKAAVIDKMAGGLARLSDARGLQLIQGRAEFESSTTVRLHDSEISRIKFRHAILATGSSPVALPGTEFKPGGRIMSSTGALALADIPERLLVVGGGYVGLELGMVYAALGSRVSLIERQERLLTGVDADLVAPLQKRLDSVFEKISLQTGVVAMTGDDSGLNVTLEGPGGTDDQRYDRVLVAIGRRPNSTGIGLENTSVQVDEKGFVTVDDRLRTADEHIFAVGDVVGGMMLAHKATREGKIAAEVIAGQSSAFDARAIPAVVYTDPQIAWCGMTEEQAKHEKIPVRVQRFPWKFSGRAATMGASEGLTKMMTDPETGRIIGVGITGRDAEGLVAEGVLAIEMGALAEDVALSIHPHPTLSETESEAAELFFGSATHILSKS
jgi:dihydrolipoamide dehydrogenase